MSEYVRYLENITEMSVPTPSRVYLPKISWILPDKRKFSVSIDFLLSRAFPTQTLLRFIWGNIRNSGNWQPAFQNPTDWEINGAWCNRSKHQMTTLPLLVGRHGFFFFFFTLFHHYLKQHQFFFSSFLMSWLLCEWNRYSGVINKLQVSLRRLLLPHAPVTLRLISSLKDRGQGYFLNLLKGK